MGLDQYLVLRKHLGNGCVVTQGDTDMKVSKDDYVEVESHIGKWRKANQIHGWFVKNVQNGQDDCREYQVYTEQLLALKKLCEDVLDESSEEYARSFLPPAVGFFFGGDTIDEYYYQDLKDTVSILDKAIALGDEDYYVNFYYSSSW